MKESTAALILIAAAAASRLLYPKKGNYYLASEIRPREKERALFA